MYICLQHHFHSHSARPGRRLRTISNTYRIHISVHSSPTILNVANASHLMPSVSILTTQKIVLPMRRCACYCNSPKHPACGNASTQCLAVRELTSRSNVRSFMWHCVHQQTSPSSLMER